MARTKKVVSEEVVEKKTHHYTKHLPEQREFQSYIIDQLVPFMEQHHDEIYTFMQKHLNDVVSKDEWNNMKKLCIDMINCVTDEDNAIFSIDTVNSIRYHEKHSSYYRVVSNRYAKYFCNHIDNSHKYDVTDEKNKKYYYRCMYVACQHFGYFILSPEKL